MNHTYIIRGDSYKKYPGSRSILYTGCVKPQALAQEKMVERIPARSSSAGSYTAMTREMIGVEPFPFGIKQSSDAGYNITFSHEQGLTPRK